jgi:hypothetical protein
MASNCGLLSSGESAGHACVIFVVVIRPCEMARFR